MNHSERTEPTLLVASARGPFVRDGEGFTRAPGGVVSALLPVVTRAGGVWIAPADDQPTWGASPTPVISGAVPLPPALRSRWYHGCCNETLWPLAHGFLDRCRFRREDWSAYREVNAAVARGIARACTPEARVWVHDYQLALVPALLRELRPDLRIGFFWHIPWPPAELARALPWVEELVHGLLGADAVGLHVPRYVRALGDTLVDLGIACEQHASDRLEVRTAGRAPLVFSCPIGIDAEQWVGLAGDPGVLRAARRLRATLATPRLLLAVDRLDYSKGVVERLAAFERLLERDPDAVHRVTLLQVGVPTREGVPDYRRVRRRVEEAVGRINGRFGTTERTPVRLLVQARSPRELASLYVAADAAVVTPLRDGMNLVAFEYLACRRQGDGRLVLSSLAGAADVLPGARLVHPHDEDALADALAETLLDETAEDRASMAAMRAHVLENDVNRWVERFVHTAFDAAPRSGLRPAPWPVGRP